MEKLFLGVGIFAVLIILEFIMMGAYQTLPSTRAKRILSVLCRVVLWLFILGYLLLVGASLYIGVDLLAGGKIDKGISVLLFAVIIAVCIYIWLVRGWIKHIKQMRG